MLQSCRNQLHFRTRYCLILEPSGHFRKTFCSYSSSLLPNTASKISRQKCLEKGIPESIHSNPWKLRASIYCTNGLTNTRGARRRMMMTCCQSSRLFSSKIDIMSNPPEANVTEAIAELAVDDTAVVLDEDGKPMTKSAIKKREKKLEKERGKKEIADRVAGEKKAREEADAASDMSKHQGRYGKLAMNQSATKPCTTPSKSHINHTSFRQDHFNMR